MAHEGGDAGGHRRQPVLAVTAGHSGGHLDLLHSRSLLASVGFWGAWAGGWAFILPNFIIVSAVGALYVHWGELSAVKAIFYGVSPAVIALILHSCYRLTKLGMTDWLGWALAAAAFVITVAL